MDNDTFGNCACSKTEQTMNSILLSFACVQATRTPNGLFLADEVVQMVY